MKDVTIYTDSACTGSPGPGGWGAVLMCQGHTSELSGFSPETTKNRMELFAAISGLRALKCSCRVTLYTNSTYLVNAFEQNTVARWMENNWKNARKEPIENQDLWKCLLMYSRMHQVEFVRVKDLSDSLMQCSKMAREQVRLHE